MALCRGSFFLRGVLLGRKATSVCSIRPLTPAIQRLIHYPKEPYHAKRVDLKTQSVLLPGEERVRASKLNDDPYDLTEKIPFSPEIQTVYEVLDHGLKVSNDGDCIGTRSPVTGEYEWKSYSEVIKKSQYVGSALIHLGLQPRKESFVGIFASNQEEFILTLYACAGYSIILVPLYETLGQQAVIFIIQQGNLPVVIVNNCNNALNILRKISEVPSLHTLIMMEKPSPEVVQGAERSKIALMTFDELENLGKNHRHDLVLPGPDDLFCIPYTSGTTGIPKGVMLTHRNMITCVSSLVVGYGKAGLYGGTIMSYLPPAHIYEIANEVASLYFARRVAFYNGDIKKLMDEVRVLKPTILPLVPRLMNAIYSNIMESIKGSTAKAILLKVALSRKEKLLKKGVITKSSLWDRLVFRKLQQALGGEVHMIITTSAPISADIMRFFRCASGCYIFEAYGQTEVLASNMTLPEEIGGGFVGPPLPCNHVKLADVPEMNYFAKDDAGEVCFRGPNVFKGYFKNPEATKECLEESGWHHSGDIGRWLPNGALQIIDRKKHLFKLSQGEYIAPEKVENVYSHSKLVAQIYVDGLSNQNYVITIVYPEPVNFQKWLKSKEYTGDTSSAIMDKSIRKKFLQELHRYGKKEGLNPLEQARNLAFVSEPFSIENELLTPTFKLKRNNARKHFEPIFRQLYEEGPLVERMESR